MPMINNTWLEYEMPNITNFYDMFSYANYSSGYMFGTLIVVAMFVIAFIAAKGNSPTEVSFAFSSYLTTIIAILLRVVMMVSDFIVIGMILITAVSTLLLARREPNW